MAASETGYPRVFSTACLPISFLEATSLIGKTPIMAAQFDPRYSYTLDVPKDFYNPDPEAEGPFHPHNRTPRSALHHPYDQLNLALVVVIHDAKRNVTADRDRVADIYPCKHATLAPLFPTSHLESNTPTWDSYMTLGPDRAQDKAAAMPRAWEKRERRPKNEAPWPQTDNELPPEDDKMLLHILDEVGVRWPGIATGEIVLLGFGAGANFALRFALRHPSRVAGVSVGAMDLAEGLLGGLQSNGCCPARQCLVERELGPVAWDLVRETWWQVVVGREDKMLTERLIWLLNYADKLKATARLSREEPDWQAAKQQMEVSKLGPHECVARELTAHGVDVLLDVVKGVGHSAEDIQWKVSRFVRRVLSRDREEHVSDSSSS